MSDDEIGEWLAEEFLPAVDVTLVPPGALDEMRAHPGPSPAFKAAIDRAQNRNA